MRLNEVLTPDLIELELKGSTREDVIRELVEILAEAGSIGGGEVDTMTEAVLKREHLGSTAIGRGVAIPHAKAPSATGFIAAFGRSPNGVEFASIDGKPVELVFLLASPPDSQRRHLKALAHISRLLSKSDFREDILKAETKKEVLDIMASVENSC